MIHDISLSSQFGQEQAIVDWFWSEEGGVHVIQDAPLESDVDDGGVIIVFLVILLCNLLQLLLHAVDGLHDIAVPKGILGSFSFLDLIVVHLHLSQPLISLADAVL